MGLGAVTLHYPLKTSHENGQLFGGIPCAVRAGFHVAFTRLRWWLSRLILVAMIWSSDNLWFIAWNHCPWTSFVGLLTGWTGRLKAKRGSGRGSGGEGFLCWQTKGMRQRSRECEGKNRVEFKIV